MWIKEIKANDKRLRIFVFTYFDVVILFSKWDLKSQPYMLNWSEQNQDMIRWDAKFDIWPVFQNSDPIRNPFVCLCLSFCSDNSAGKENCKWLRIFVTKIRILFGLVFRDISKSLAKCIRMGRSKHVKTPAPILKISVHKQNRTLVQLPT